MGSADFAASGNTGSSAIATRKANPADFHSIQSIQSIHPLPPSEWPSTADLSQRASPTREDVPWESEDNVAGAPALTLPSAAHRDRAVPFTSPALDHASVDTCSRATAGGPQALSETLIALSFPACDTAHYELGDRDGTLNSLPSSTAMAHTWTSRACSPM